METPQLHSVKKNGSQSVRPLRVLRSEALRAAEGLATDESLAHSVASGHSPPTLHLYRYQPCVLVGRYQNLVEAVDLDRCEALGYACNRRHTGGGTVVMDHNQLATALVLTADTPGIGSTVRARFEFLARIIRAALCEFDVDAEFVGKNDIEVGGRKIAGLAISEDIADSVFFHVSLLLDFDVARMVELLRLPTGADGVACFSERMTTLRRERVIARESQLGWDDRGNLSDGEGLAMSEAEWLSLRGLVQDALVRHTAHALGCEAVEGEFTKDEIVLRDDLIARRYSRPEWVFSERVARRWSGRSITPTPGGVLRLYVSATGGILDSVLITGNYFARNREVARLEAALRGVRANAAAIREVVESLAETSIYRIPPEQLAEALMSAVAQARSAPRGAQL